MLCRTLFFGFFGVDRFSKKLPCLGVDPIFLANSWKSRCSWRLCRILKTIIWVDHKIIIQSKAKQLTFWKFINLQFQGRHSTCVCLYIWLLMSFTVFLENSWRFHNNYHFSILISSINFSLYFLTKFPICKNFLPPFFFCFLNR